MLYVHVYVPVIGVIIIRCNGYVIQELRRLSELRDKVDGQKQRVRFLHV